MAQDSDWPRLAAQIATDPVSARLWATLRRRADALLATPPLERTLTGRRLLMIARQALERIGVLALVGKVSGERRIIDRCVAELVVLARFSDWNPSHFLDVAETALAVSLGYDWLYDDLSEQERDEIATALIEKAIRPSLDDSAAGNWWLDARENWVQVCHGGLAAAAIAIADRDPELSRFILDRALAKLPPTAASYAPDGAYPEGPMYWSYGTSYQVVLAAALLRFTGDALGVDAFPGFAASAGYLNAVTSPHGDYFNYADCVERRRLQAPLFWLSHRFGRPDWLTHELAALEDELATYEAAPSTQYWHYDMAALALLWYQPRTDPRQPATAAWFGRGEMPVATFRGSGLGGAPWYFAIKGGAVGLSHSHMDVGSFVFERDGVRWAIDLGMQDYESLESFGVDLWNEREPASQRWDVFRIGPDAHNIVRFDGKPQRLLRTAEFTQIDGGGGTIDLTPLYSDPVDKVTRRFAIGPAGDLRIEDRWDAGAATRVNVQWLTRATVEVDGSIVRLAQDGRHLTLAAEASSKIRVAAENVADLLHPFDEPCPGVTRIRIHAECPAGPGWLRVAAVQSA